MREMKTYSLTEMKDRHIGKRGTMKREQFEIRLVIKILLQKICNAL